MFFLKIIKILKSNKYKDDENENTSSKKTLNENYESDSFSESIKSSDLEIIKEKYKDEISKLENFYEEILKDKISEYEQSLAELNEKLVIKESELEQFRNDNLEIREKYNDLVDIYHESEESKSTVIQKRGLGTT